MNSRPVVSVPSVCFAQPTREYPSISNGKVLPLFTFCLLGYTTELVCQRKESAVVGEPCSPSPCRCGGGGYVMSPGDRRGEAIMKIVRTNHRKCSYHTGLVQSLLSHSRYCHWSEVARLRKVTRAPAWRKASSHGESRFLSR